MHIEATELKDRLFELLGKIEYGEERLVVITRRGEPIAKLVDYHKEPYAVKLGVAEGKFVIPEDWDAKDKEIAEMFGVK